MTNNTNNFSPAFFSSVINGYLPEPHASLLNGILFGINLRTSYGFYTQLKTVGLLHIVVLSGINITLLCSIVASCTRFFSKFVSCLITILTVILFVVFVGPQAPVIRSAIMGILTLVAVIFGRKTVALYLLLLSAIITLIIWHEWIYSLSFYLSYGATLGIILFGTVRVKKPKKLSQTIAGYIWKELKPSLAAQIFTTPLIFIAFKQISFIAPVSNILVAFTIAPLMVFGFLTALLGKVHFLFGIIPALVCFGILQYLIWIIRILSTIPGAFVQF